MIAKVSVIVPAYNQARYLGLAIQSVLDQTFRDFELVVVDDGSTDNTQEVLSSFHDQRLRIVRQANAGLSAARNTGLRASSAPFISFLDADDLILPDKLALLVAYLDSQPDVGLVAGCFRRIDADGNVRGEQQIDSFVIGLPALLLGNSMPVHASVLRKSWLDQVGDFDESLRACEDWDLWLRMSAGSCKFAAVQSVVAEYRMHTAQMTGEAQRMRTASLAVLNKFFSRPNLPLALQEYRGQAYALALCNAAARAYRARDFGSGQHDLAEAVRLDPTLRANHYQRLMHLLTGWADDPRSGNPDTYLSNIYANLPPTLLGLRGELRRAKSALLLRPLFRSSTHAWRLSKRALFTAVCYDPAWLLNRGVLRMLAEALLPTKIGG